MPPWLRIMNESASLFFKNISDALIRRVGTAIVFWFHYFHLYLADGQITSVIHIYFVPISAGVSL